MKKRLPRLARGYDGRPIRPFAPGYGEKCFFHRRPSALQLLAWVTPFSAIALICGLGVKLRHPPLGFAREPGPHPFAAHAARRRRARSAFARELEDMDREP